MTSKIGECDCESHCELEFATCVFLLTDKLLINGDEPLIDNQSKNAEE